MPHDRASIRLVEQLLLLTHLALRAVEDGEYEELETLMDRRAEMVTELQSHELDTEATQLLARVTEAEKALERKIKDEMEESVRQMHGLYLERRGHQAYRAA